MRPNVIGLTVLVSLAIGVAAGLVTSGAAIKLRAGLFSGRWFLLWFVATLLTIVGNVLALDLAANWNNPGGILHVYVDPGALEKFFPLLATIVGALRGGWLASRSFRYAPVPPP